MVFFLFISKIVIKSYLLEKHRLNFKKNTDCFLRKVPINIAVIYKICYYFNRKEVINMSLTKEGYKKRLIDAKIAKYLKIFGERKLFSLLYWYTLILQLYQ